MGVYVDRNKKRRTGDRKIKVGTYGFVMMDGEKRSAYVCRICPNGKVCFKVAGLSSARFEPKPGECNFTPSRAAFFSEGSVCFPVWEGNSARCIGRVFEDTILMESPYGRCDPADKMQFEGRWWLGAFSYTPSRQEHQLLEDEERTKRISSAARGNCDAL